MGVMHGSCKDFPSAPDKGAHAPPAIDQTATFVVPPRPPRGCCRLAMGPWLGSHHNFEFAFWAHLPYVHMVCCAARISGAAARAGWHRHFSPAPVLFFKTNTIVPIRIHCTKAISWQTSSAPGAQPLHN